MRIDNFGLLLDIISSVVDASFACSSWAGGIEVSWLSPHVHGEGRHCAPHCSVVVLSSFFIYISMYIYNMSNRYVNLSIQSN